MLSEKEVKRISKFLSLILRHKPETIGLHLDENGWADVSELIAKVNEHHFHLAGDILHDVVATNSKQRFSFNENKTKIRANQGHSIAVDLQLQPANPPQLLYHGTGEKSVPFILKEGLQKRTRQHVHLSIDIPTAMAIGKRHGKPKIFIVAAHKMQQDGYTFYLSENNVWLTDNIPVQYLQMSEKICAV